MILVTGGTGLVGSHLLYFLLKAKYQVRAIYRTKSSLEKVKSIFELYSKDGAILFDSIEWLQADITDIPALERVFEGITEVYHCAAMVNFNPSKYHLLKKVNIEGTANIVNLCLHFGIKKLCFVSSIATLSKKPEQESIDESSFWNPDEKNSVYAISKYGAEMEVWRGTQEGLDAVIVNPGVILGVSPHKDGSNQIINVAKKGLNFYPSGIIGTVDVRDVAQIMIRLMDASIVNERYVLVSSNIPIKKLLSEISLLSGNKPPKYRLSRFLMEIISSLDSLSHFLFRTRRKLPKDLVRSMFSTTTYNSSKIIKALNYNFIPISDTLRMLFKNR